MKLSKGNSEAAIVIKGCCPVYDRNFRSYYQFVAIDLSSPVNQKVNDNFQVYVSRSKCKVDPDGYCEFLSDDESGSYFIPHHDIVS